MNPATAPATATATAPGPLADVFKQVPFMQLLGVTREVSADGYARMSMTVRPELTNLFDAAHGGVPVTLLDSAMASAAMSSVNFEAGVVTLNLNTSFLASGRGRLLVEGRRTGGGRSICYCEGTVRGEDGEVLARAIGSFKFKGVTPPEETAQVRDTLPALSVPLGISPGTETAPAAVKWWSSPADDPL